MFANTPDNIQTWVSTLLITFVQGWFVQDIIVILVRNNLDCTKTIVRSWKYQILEKVVVGPLRGVIEVFRSLVGLTFT